jgi:steroid delta-isomerase
MKHAVERIVVFFETLTPQSLARFGEYYADDAFFKDPFNELRGLKEVMRVFEHMYRTLDEPRFVVTARLVDGDQCFLTWDFRFRFKSVRPEVEQTIRGSTHLKFAADGRVNFHRDYWDAAEELYEKLPFIGGLMRWLRKRTAS